METCPPKEYAGYSLSFRQQAGRACFFIAVYCFSNKVNDICTPVGKKLTFFSETGPYATYETFYRREA